MPIRKSSTMPLPRGWKDHIKSAVLQVISLANYAVAQARGRALNGKNARARQAAEIDRLRQEVALRQEEMQIKDVRWSRVPALRRPHYTPTERMAIEIVVETCFPEESSVVLDVLETNPRARRFWESDSDRIA